MTNAELDQLAKHLVFQDPEFLEKLSAKTVDLLRGYLRMIERELPEIPKAVLIEALILVTASQIEESLSAQHGADLLRKIAASLEEKSRVTVQ